MDEWQYTPVPNILQQFDQKVMGKKRFIGKGEGQKFHLLHRSQTDAAYGGEFNPTDVVLVPAQQNKRNARDDESVVDVKSYFRSGDHIRPDGFKNDGYDYSQHLKEMGGGTFISVDGQVRESQVSYKQVDLPPELLPSEREMERNLDAIVISDKYMDEDIRNALFNDEDDNGPFEELDDDFVMQAMAEPEVPDFDFDAHIARLIKASERDLLYDPSKPKKSSKSKESEDIVHDDDDSDWEDELDEDEEDGEIQPNKKVDPKYQDYIDSQFQKTIQEYDDSDIGDLEEDDMIEGDIEESNVAFEAALDEFLKEQEENKKYEKLIIERSMESKMTENLVTVQQGMTELTISDADQYNQYAENKSNVDSDLLLHDEKLRGQQFKDQLLKQIEAEEIIREVEREVAQQTPDEVWNSQAYLKKEKIKSEWDCETILSTYSTLDNHPSVIKDEYTKFQPHKSRFVRATEQIDELRKNTLKKNEELLSNPNRVLVGEYFQLKSVDPVKQIKLSNKSQLPVGYGPDKNRTKESHSDDDDESSCSDEEIQTTMQEAKTTIVRNRNETKEEKKARKEKAKLDKRTKKNMKKEIKNTYKNVESRQVHQMANQQDINNAHVFKTVS